MIGHETAWKKSDSTSSYGRSLPLGDTASCSSSEMILEMRFRSDLDSAAFAEEAPEAAAGVALFAGLVFGGMMVVRYWKKDKRARIIIQKYTIYIFTGLYFENEIFRV